MKDIDRDRFMTPAEAKEYGLIDEIVSPRALAVAPMAEAASSGSDRPVVSDGGAGRARTP
jgi:hypothetical protein